MAKVKPGRPRALVESIPGGIRVSVRTRKNWFSLAGIDEAEANGLVEALRARLGSASATA